MNIVFKGRFKGIDSLPKGNLPDNAIKFKEPNNTVQLNLVCLLFTIPLLIILVAFIAAKILILGGATNTLVKGSLWGYMLAFLFVVPHELLHAVCFPKNATKEVYYSLWGAFVVSTYPISKLRFIMMSLCPNLLFGILPLTVWLFLPSGMEITKIIYSFAFISLLFGSGDLMNVFNALTQMPKGTYQQLSGFNSYWFYPLSKTSTKEEI